MIVAARYRARHFAADERGASMVEFAIVAALLFMLVFGIVDFGRAYLLYNNLTNAVREGARYAAVIGNTTADTVAVRSSVRSKIMGSSAQQALGDLSVTYVGTAPNQTVRVRLASYPFNPVSFLALKSNKLLTVTAEFRYEFQ